MTLEELLTELEGLSPHGKGFKPHKYLALLAVMRLIRDGTIASTDVPFDGGFAAHFKELLKQYGAEGDRNRAHTPFFHLGSTSFWTLVPNDGLEADLAGTTTIGSAGELRRLVHHARLSPDVLKLMRDESSGRIISQYLEDAVSDGQRSRHNEVRESRANYSLFAHESQALQWLDARRGAARMVQNFNLHDPATNAILECDAIFVAASGVYMVELKHWTGTIKISSYNWLLNGWEHRKNPHHTNIYKAKVLRGLLQHAFPQLPFFYVTSVVVLTNDTAVVEGSDQPATAKDNPTFDGLPTFVRYLKAQRSAKGNVLSASQVEMVAERLEALRKEGPRGREVTFPGYETLEVLSRSEHHVEAVVRPEFSTGDRRQRIRLFYPPRPDDPQRENKIRRGTNTIKAIAQIGEHPNILAVSPMPHIEGAIAECSDWSVEGTLRDRLDIGPLSAADALQIAEGILQGLAAAHDAGVIHRALFPENILLKGDEPRLMNFDLSYQLEETGTHVTVIPKPEELPRSPYLAPEVLSGEDIDPATDLFSVGVILFEMLTGAPPFKASTDLAASGGSLPDMAFSALTDGQHKLPAGIVDLIGRCIQFDRAKRPCDAGELAGLLKDAIPPPSAVPKATQIGDRYDCYRIDEELARGRQATVYAVTGIGGEKLVLKLFDHDVPVDRIQREEQAAGRVRSPYLLHARHTIHWRGERYGILFDCVRGPSLRDKIRAKDVPSNEEFLSAARSLLRAIELLHGSGENGESLLHNDIKPENVLLVSREHPVLIDFGSASPPGVRAFRGTERYAAPDLRLGCDFNHCPGGDCFALGVTLFEWFFGVHPFDKLFRGAPIVDVSKRRDGVAPALMDWFKAALATDPEARFGSAQHMLERLQAASAEPLKKEAGEPVHEKPKSVPVVPDSTIHVGNPFVAYLNSLHSASAATSGMLAESQAINPFFSHIHVSSPLAIQIAGSITDAGHPHIVLTGHAGDGKSTVALEVFKRLKGLALDAPLDDGLKQHEVVKTESGVTVHVIKDMSELSLAERVRLVHEARDASATERYIIVSNTGALLAAFKAALSTDLPPAELEDQLLGSLSADNPDSLRVGKRDFSIINLARCSHIDLAIEVLHRIVHQDRWTPCQDKACSAACPIFRNAQTLNGNWAIVSERIRMIYERLHLYGKRLTMRQMIAHLAYAVTSGLSYPEVYELGEDTDLAPFLFINRIFGDTGRENDLAAGDFLAVQHLRAVRMGQSSCAGIERRLWLGKIGPQELGLPSSINDLFRALHAAALSGDGMPRQAARIQLRRLVYFLASPGTPSTAASDFVRFTSRFLGSPLLHEYLSWQGSTGESLSRHRARGLLTRVLHVLQEQFTGTRLPESQRFEGPLYVTLNRSDRDIRQSAQVVLASFPAQDFTLRLVERRSPTGAEGRILVLSEQRSGEQLELSLPFLDYVLLRHEGAIGTGLQCSYLDRLESFKARILAKQTGSGSHNIMLVRLETNHAFRSHEIEVSGNRLEVLQ